MPASNEIDDTVNESIVVLIKNIILLAHILRPNVKKMMPIQAKIGRLRNTHSYSVSQLCTSYRRGTK